MNNIKTNIKKAIKKFEKENGRKPDLGAMWEDWFRLSVMLTDQNINTQFEELDMGSGRETIATYYCHGLKNRIILDWDVSSQYEDMDNLIDTIAGLEEEGIKIEQDFKNISEIRETLSKTLEYLFDSEKKHYEESSKEEKKNHIYKLARDVKNWLNKK